MTDLIGFHPPLVRKGIFKGVNLAALVARFWRHESVRSEGRCPTVRWHAHERGGAWGVAHIEPRTIELRLSEYASIEAAAETLLHEIVHCALPVRERHGELFCRRLIACAREAFGLDLDTASLLELPRGRHSKVAYAIDEAIVGAMEAARVGARLRESAETRFEPPPPETEFDILARQATMQAAREAKAAARIAAREAHARKKLVEWQRKVEAAKQAASKWRVKVRYYERRQEAAKRRS